MRTGFFFFIGRKDDVINSGGLKIAPAEVEAAALEIEEITDCICIEIIDRISGSVPKLLYIAEHDLDPRMLTSFLAERLEPFKIPRQFERVAEIAKTYNGKPDRKHYREE